MKNFFYAMAATLFALPALAQDGGASTGSMAAALAITVAAAGGAIGQGLAASSALEGIARNPSAQSKIFGPMIIALALIESLVIYALVIAFVKG